IWTGTSGAAKARRGLGVPGPGFCVFRAKTHLRVRLKPDTTELELLTNRLRPLLSGRRWIRLKPDAIELEWCGGSPPRRVRRRARLKVGGGRRSPCASTGRSINCSCRSRNAERLVPQVARAVQTLDDRARSRCRAPISYRRPG